jgi:hypothetical protein
MRKLGGHMTAEQFTENLKQTCGDNLLAVVLYGSTAAGDGVEGKSDVNLMAVLKEAGLPALKAVAKAAGDWIKEGNPPPLVFSRERLLASGDTFPIELSDMKDFHRLLHGEDLLPGIKVEAAHLRLAVEREFKGKLLLLRGSYLACCGDPEAVERLLTASLSQFLVLCRAALRLREGTVPASKLECAEKLQDHADFYPDVFRDAHALRRGEYKGGQEPEVLFGRYLAAIDALCGALDGWAAE